MDFNAKVWRFKKNMNKKEYSIDIAGKKITAIFTDLADQAGGSVMLSSMGTVVLATALYVKGWKKQSRVF